MCIRDSYQSTADMKALDACTFQVGKDDFNDTQVIEAKLGSATVFCIPVSLHNDSTFFAGDGTEDFPYLIRGGSNKNSAEAQIGYVFNASTSSTDNSNSIYADCHFVLGQDVDMQGLIYKGFQSFSGSFDGNGFTLKNFQLSSNVSNARFGKTTGLFGVLTGTVRNLNVENGRFITEKVAEIKGYSQSGNKYAGIIAGLVEQGGKVEYCQVKNSIVRQTLATRENISKDDDRNLIDVYKRQADIPVQHSVGEAEVLLVRLTAQAVDGRLVNKAVRQPQRPAHGADLLHRQMGERAKIPGGVAVAGRVANPILGEVAGVGHPAIAALRDAVPVSYTHLDIRRYLLIYYLSSVLGRKYDVIFAIPFCMC